MAYRKDITFTVGDGWAIKLSFFRRIDGVKTARDVTESTFLSQVRRRVSSSSVLATIAIQNHTDLPDDLATNEIYISLTPTDTIAIARDAVWDFQETESGGTPQTKLSGKVIANPQVSRT